MADHQPLNATFYAFRKREKSGVLTGASIAVIVLSLAICAAFIALFWRSLGPFINWYVELLGVAATNDTGAMSAIGLPEGLGALAAGWLVWIFVLCVLYAAYEAACLRWMTRGETGGLFGLSLGADTWRVYAGYWVWFGLYLVFSIAMAIVMAVILGVVVGTSGGDSVAALTVLPVFYIVQYGFLIYFAVRLAPAAATSVARKKFSFFKAWTVTRGRFWALFGSFFLLAVFYVLFCVVTMVGWFVLIFAGAAPDMSTLSDPAQLNAFYFEMMQHYIASFTKPETWGMFAALQVVSWLVMTMLYLMAFGINARAAVAAIEDGKIAPAA